MKKIFVKIVILGVILIITGFVGDIITTAGLMKTGDFYSNGAEEYTTWNEIISSNIEADLIINGNSRAYKHVNPFILDEILNLKTYNIGMSGGSIEKQYIRYLTFEKYNEKPKYIIQEVDFWTLEISNSVDDRILPYIPYLAGKEYLNKKYKNNSYLHFYRYMKRYDFIIRGFLEFFNIKHFPEVRKRGFFETDLQWNSYEFSQIIKGDSLISKKQNEAIEVFDNYLLHCKKNNIQVILVISPVYYKATKFFKDSNELLDLYRSYSEKYNIPFFDYSNDTICYDTTYFYNAMHLNKKGSELYSIKLAQDIDLFLKIK